MKKKISIVILLFCLTFSGKAAKYYFSSTTGDDSRSSATAQNANTPWRTLTKLNAFFSSFSPGDSILLKRGETFYGFIQVSRSGTALNPIIIAAYGTGSKPKIIGLQTMSTFTQSGDVWTSVANSLLTSETRIVLDDGVLLSVGRYPNLNTTNRGYLMYETATATSITDNQLSTTPTNWTGATVAFRWSTYHIKKAVVASHANTKLTWTTAFSSAPVNSKAGYFFMNDLRTLDQNGEYYINPSKQISIQSTTGAPAGIQASAIPSLIKSTNFNYIHIVDLNLSGANSYGISIGEGTSSGGGGTGFIIKNCDINYSGESGIFVNNHANIIIRDNSISNSLDIGIRLNNSPNFRIAKNSITNSHMIAGMGGETLSGDGIYIPIAVKGTIDSNRITNSGLNGVRFDGDSIEVKYNLFDGYCLIKNDGGAIYIAPPNGGIIQRHGQKVVGNVILNGGDASAGTTYTMTLAYGIYPDVSASNILIQGNSLSGGDGGIFLHRGINNIIRDNTVYNFNKGFFIAADITNATALANGSATELVRNITVKNNVWFATNSSQRPVYFYAVNNDVRLFGTMDSNYIQRPSLEPNNINAAGTLASGGTINVYTGSNYFYSLLGGWQTAYAPYDLNSKKSPKGNDVLRFEANSSYRDSVVNLNSGTRDYTWLTAQGVRVKGTLTLAPYSSVILIRDTIVPIVVVPNVHPTVSITAPANGASYVDPGTVNITASAADTDGTITKVDFYSGTTLLGTDNSSPYTYTWNSVPSGGYSLTARAFDNSGDSTTSTAISISVIAVNTPPTVSITSPVTGATFSTPADFDIEADATDANDSILVVDFYENTTYLGSDSVRPYVWNISGYTTGDYTFHVVAKDYEGDSTTSASITITVNPPPPLAANADVGTILCNGGSTIITIGATGGTAPYTGTGSNVVSAGTYTYIVEDDDGTKDTIVVTVSQPAVLSLTDSIGAIGYYAGTTEAHIFPTGGTAPYQYQINNGQWQTSNVFVVTAGGYMVNVRDANGCSEDIFFSVTQPTSTGNLNMSIRRVGRHIKVNR